MILTCPSCDTQYVVKDGAIPPQGRQVRCASCKHSWHQNPDGEDGSPAAAVASEPATDGMVQEHADMPPEPDHGTSAPVDATDEPEDEEGSGEEDESLIEATMIEPRAGPEAEERAYEESLVAGGDATVASEPEERGEWVPATADDPVAEEDFSPFAVEDEDEPRRRGPLVTILILALLAVAVAALFWFTAPDSWKSRIGLSTGGASPLALVTTHMDRQRLESGNELLTVTGRVINPTGSEQPVPPIQAQLKSATGKVVYSWSIAPPAQSLPAGASASFNSAEVNVPPGGEVITLTLGAPKA